MFGLQFIQASFGCVSGSNLSFGDQDNNTRLQTAACDRVSRRSACAFILLTMLLLTAPASTARAVEALEDGANPVTSFWNSGVSSAGSQEENIVAGYPLSALDLSIPNQEKALCGRDS